MTGCHARWLSVALAIVAAVPADAQLTHDHLIAIERSRVIAQADRYLGDAPVTAWPLRPDVMYFDACPIRHPALLLGGIALRQPRYVELWNRLDPDPTVDEVIRSYPIRESTLWMR